MYCVQIRICHEFISIPKPKFLCGDIGRLQYTVASSYVLETHNFHSLAQTSLSLSRLKTHIIEQSHLVKKPLKKIPQRGICPVPCVLHKCTVVFARKCRLFCLCVCGQCRVYYIYHVEFHFRFRRLVSFPV